MTLKRFEGRTALITGGSSGIGFATAKLLKQEGAKLVITGRNPKKLKKAALDLGDDGTVFTFACDVAALHDIEQLIKFAKTHVGQLDIVFANAGNGIFKSFKKFTEADFDIQVATNFKGAFFTVQKSLELMKDGGAIILNSSWTLHRPMGVAALYAATKAATANLAQTLTTELAPRAIRVNSISPGYINTDQFNENMLPEEEAAVRRGEVPLARFGNAEDVAKVVAFLASDEASYLAGQDILIDGGMVHSKVEPKPQRQH